jgi:hypothetical protein
MMPADLGRFLAARLDGPHTDNLTATAAELAAEAVRLLNYATGPHADTGLTYPATVYAVTASLSLAASRLGQLSGQMTDFLDRERAAGRLGDDLGRDPVLVVERARRDLEAAARAAGLLARALADAQNDVASLHQREGR